ncbi:coproporphyrinogen dehydrogenase HemZ [Peptostreptococcus russellii]|uniref:Oxygen-independent coproporphyrinogen-3 oxidase n=1 Tax=Peptostreptococcus russellii TaxID=215200 RepID=A0A1H8I3R7_9FIRM|nr:coproporphyrinogen dehydrogenase HemZ [Peptostreptococcus russellii]SEN62488.1 oxygen-independent coproporphyrinogen-3 oxidase [Peptostreptococcus russellii]
MRVLLKGHDYKYEIAEFLKLFSSEFSFVEGSEDFDVIKDVENSELVVNELKVERKEDRVELFTKTIVFENSVEVYKKEISEKIYIRKISEEEKNSIIAEKSGILGNKNILNSEYRMTDSLKSGNISTVIVDNNEHNKKIFAKTNKKLDNNIRTISKRIIERSLFYYLNEKFDANVPWGILTGIRPVKIVQELLDDGLEIEDIRENMKKQYLIRDEKLDLIIDIALRERPFIYPVTDKKISLYVSVPFCPTRCLYCSFPSHPLEKFGSYRHEYVETVLKEAEGVADIIEKQGKEIETLYIGGGTPTALEAEDLEYLIQGLFERLDLSNIKEFTVEAGRPDSITREKLEALKRNNVSRISINPQTMNQETLDFVGRKHSVEDIKDCFILARELGFDNINMDLILGLPGENLDMVENTMKEIVSLNPESVTVHTLALKRASDLNINMESYKDALIGYQTVIDMISLSRKYMDEYGYNPYYMYRQKHMLGNLENIGYAKEGYECLYNMQIMEEKQSNYAIGAGAVSKFVYLDENRIERVDDVKNLQVYLERVDDMILKKYREVEKNGN